MRIARHCVNFSSNINSVVSSYTWFILFDSILGPNFFQHIPMMFIPHCRYFNCSQLLHPEFGSKFCQYSLTDPHVEEIDLHTPRGQKFEDYIMI